MARTRAVVTSWPCPPTPKSYKYSSPFGLGVRGRLVVGGRDSVGLVYIGLATHRLQTSDSALGRPSPLGSVEIP